MADYGEYLCRVSGEEYLADVLSLNIPPDANITRLVPTPSVVHAEVGSIAKLPCHVEDLRCHKVLWKNSNNDVVSLQRRIYSGDSRFKVIHGNTSEWSLRIKDVKDTDFGQYTCIVNSNPVLTRTVTLKNKGSIKMAPALSRDSQYRVRVEAEEGDKVTLVCNFKANPPAKVMWYQEVVLEKGFKMLKEIGEGSSLVIQSATPDNNGNYICRARNGIKPRGRASTELNVISLRCLGEEY